MIGRCMVLLAALILLCADTGSAAFDQPHAFPSSASCGETLAGEFTSPGSIISNPAAGAYCKRGIAGFGFQRLFELKELDQYATVASVRAGKFVFGATFSSLGRSDLMVEQAAGLTLSVRHSKLSVGFRVNYNAIDQPAGYADLSAVSLECGMIADVGEAASLYASVVNPFEPKLAFESSLHRMVKLGMRFVPDDRLTLAADIEHTRGRGTRYAIGESYRIGSKVRLNAGFRSAPFVPSFGLDVTYRGTVVSYGYRYHPDLGETHLWGLSFDL